MPLLKRQPFVKQKLPPDLDPEEELFFCKLTKEVFRDYDEFFERVILCNSLVWTCELTGRPGLTYQEALESEGRARRCLKSFPDSLKIPVLYLSTLTHRGRLADMCDDVYGFARERFFVGENIEGVIDGQRIPCEVVKVVGPPATVFNGFHGNDNAESVVESENKMNCTNETEKKKHYGPHPSHYQYHLVTLEDEAKHILNYQNILRKKGVFTREKIKLFLKQYCEPRDGVWKLKKSIEKKCNITMISFSDIFAGPLPKFVRSLSNKQINRSTKSAKSKPVLNGKHASGKGKSDVKKGTRDIKNKPITIEDIKEMRKQLENRQKEREEEKQRRKEEREKEREKKREERRLKAEILREWQRPRDDLECDDLKDIPTFPAVNCNFPNELFGDAIMVLEFINTFGELLKLEDVFPQGFGFDYLEKALVESDIRGVFGEVLQFFMQAIFNFQESEEFAMANYSFESPDIPESCDDESDLSSVQALQVATAAAAWPQLHQGLSLNKLALDSFTISEILRLHFLSFGSQFACIKWQQQLKGTYTIFDDPALQLRLRDPALLKALNTKTVFEFNSGERLQILHLLINQLLNFVSIRYHIEENLEKVRNARIDLKQMQWAEQRKEREEAALRLQKQGEDNKNEETNGETHEVEDIKTKKRRTAEEIAQQKRDNLKKRELMDIIARLQSSSGVQPLGRDRAYRRFWLFDSIPGLYVEDDDEFVGQCLSNPTPMNNESTMQENQNAPELEKIILSDKENEVNNEDDVDNVLPPVLKNHKLLSDNHPTGKINNSNCVTNSTINDSNVDDDSLVKEKFSSSTNDIEVNEFKTMNDGQCKNTEFVGKCTANLSNCPVHSRIHRDEKKRWCFVSSVEEFDALLMSLNQRGFRESSLKDALYHDKPRVVQSILHCPKQKLGCDKAQDLQHTNELRKGTRINGVQLSNEVVAEEGMEMALREMLIDIEERIYAGGLGSLKVNDRELWRKAIQEKGYDMQCEGGLKWGQCTESTQIDHDSDSGRGTPMDISESEPTTHRSSSPVPVNQAVKDLASALLQIAQGTETKYLRSPLGEDVDNKKLKLKSTDSRKVKKETTKEDDTDKENGDKENKTKPQKTVYMRWEESLMACTSFSQVFVHLSTLERSIEWSRSVLNARCRICHRRGDAERMLLCDECNRGHHTYCLKPPLMEIPAGDWFCQDCRPRPKVSSPSARRPARRISYTDDEDDEIELQENLSEFDGDSNFTLRDEYDEFEEEDESEVNNDDTCDTCERGGHLICCDSCPSAFHLECVDPPLRRVPKGRWDCPNCSQRSQLSENLKGRLRNHGKRPASEITDSSPAKRTRSRDRPILDEDEIWMIGRKKHGPPVRRGASRDAPVDYKFCDQMLMEMSRNECSWPFMRPVGRKQVPVYYEVIKRPIDLATMRFKLNNMEYRSTKHFLMDVLLLIQNCIMYNALDSNEYIAAVELLKFVEQYSVDVGFAGLGDLLEHSTCPSIPSSPQPPPLARRPESKPDFA